MLKIGITGGIGTGKTTVCDIWQSLGAHIINADDVAKKIMADKEIIKNKIMSTFGAQSYHPDGSLNRQFLADQAFDRGRVGELNAIVHPHIPKEVELLMQNADEEDTEMVVYEAALLLQNLRPSNLDYIVLVLADEENRIKRVQKRDDVSRDLVMDRISKQQDFSELKHLADAIIENNGTMKKLKKRAEALYYKFLNV